MPAVELDLKTLKRKSSKATKRSAPKKSKSLKGLSSVKKMYAGSPGALARKAKDGFMNPEKIASAAKPSSSKTPPRPPAPRPKPKSAVRLDPVTLKSIKANHDVMNRAMENMRSDRLRF